MKVYGFIILVFFSSFVFSSSDGFDQLGNSYTFQNNNFYGSSLKVVQKRLLPKKFLSDISLGLSSTIKGLEHVNNRSAHVDYRFFLNNRWAINLKYLWHFNSMTEEGRKEVEKRGYIPLDLKYPQKQSYMGGVDWYPFYGKAILYNYLIRFDLYASFSGGMVELINWDKKIPIGSLSLGFVSWWNKNFNTRLELQWHYYKYVLFNGVDTHEPINKSSYRIYISTGALF